MPTPSPIIAASCGAKFAVSKTWVPSVTRLSPTPRAKSAVSSGRPIATEKLKHDLDYQERHGTTVGPAKDLSPQLAAGIERVAKRIYRASHVEPGPGVLEQLAAFEALGYGDLPVCMAKTQYSFTTNPDLRGAPVDHVVPVREVRLSAGAGFVVAICGNIMTMPGLPRVPAADSIDIGADGRIVGLF